jgi:hypothetical protein
MSTDRADRKPYTSPVVEELGSIDQLTQEIFKDLTGIDGVTFQNQQLGPVS